MRGEYIPDQGLDARYAYDGWREVEELTPVLQGEAHIPAVRKALVWGSESSEILSYQRWDAQTSSWVGYAVSQDEQGSVTWLHDASGNEIERTEYDSFGQAEVHPATGGTQSVSSVDFGFTYSSYRLDPETSFLYARNRYYCATWGRFIASDPAGNWRDGANTGNGYSYVGNAPTLGTDPLGLASGPGGYDDGVLCGYPGLTSGPAKPAESAPSKCCGDSDYGVIYRRWYIQATKYFVQVPKGYVDVTSLLIDGAGSRRMTGQYPPADDPQGGHSGFTPDGGVVISRADAEAAWRAGPVLSELPRDHIDVVVSVLATADNIWTGIQIAMIATGVAAVVVVGVKAWLKRRACCAAAKKLVVESPRLLEQPIKILQKDLQHVINRHTVGGAASSNASLFNAGEDIAQLIERGTQFQRHASSGNKFVRVFDVGRDIGCDRATGLPTRMMTIVTRSDGTLVTAHPGVPKGWPIK